MTTERRTVEIIIEHLTKGLDRVQTSIDKQKELGADTAALQKEFDELEQALQQQKGLQDLIDDLESTQAQLESSTKAADEYQGQLTKVQQEAEKAAGKHRDAAQAYDEAKTSVNDLAAQIKAHATRLAELREERAKNTTTTKQAIEAYGKESDQVKDLVARDRELAEAIQAETVAKAKAAEATTKAKQEASALKDALAAEKRELNEANVALDKTATAHDKAADRAADQARKLEDLQSELSAAGVDTADLAGEQRRLDGQVEQLERQFETFGTAVDQSTAKLIQQNTISKTAATRIAALGVTLGNLATDAIRKTADGARDLVGRIIDLGSKSADYQKSLERLTGSQEAASQVWEALNAISRETGTQVEANVEAYRTLKNFGLDPLDGTMQAIIDQTAALGGKQETAERITLALGQAYAKGKLQAEEMLQLVEAGVPVYDLMAKATGRNAQELQDMARKGELGRDSIRQLIAVMGEAAEGAAADRLEAFGGIIQRLRENFSAFLRRIGDSGFVDTLGNQLNRLNVFFEQNKEKADELAKAIGDFLSRAVEGFAGLIEWVTKNAGAIGTFAQAVTLLVGIRFAEKIADWGRSLVALKDHVTAADGKLAIFTENLKKVPKQIVITFAFLAWEAGVKIGDLLHEKFESVRLAGGLLAEGFARLAAAAKLVWDVLSSPLSIPKAWDDYKAELVNISTHFQQIRQDATDSGQAALEAADKSRQAAEQATPKVEELSNALGDAAAGAEQLSTGADNAAESLDQVGESAREAAPALEELRAGALQRLGIDADEITTGLSAGFRQVAADVDAVTASGEESEKVIAAVVDRLIEAAASSEEVTAAQGQLKNMLDEGRIAAGTYHSAMDLLQKKQTETAAEVERAGAVTSQVLRQQADDLRQVYNEARGANAAISEQRRLWLAVAAAEIHAAGAAGKAAQAIVEAGLKAEGAINGWNEELVELIDRYAIGDDVVHDFGEAAWRSHYRATQAINAQGQALAALMRDLDRASAQYRALYEQAAALNREAGRASWRNADGSLNARPRRTPSDPINQDISGLSDEALQDFRRRIAQTNVPSNVGLVQLVEQELANRGLGGWGVFPEPGTPGYEQMTQNAITRRVTDPGGWSGHAFGNSTEQPPARRVQLDLTLGGQGVSFTAIDSPEAQRIISEIERARSLSL